MKKVRAGFIFCMFFILGMVLCSSRADAYIDPSAMTYIVQVVAGIIIAGGAAFAFYFKKIKRKFKRSVSNSKTEDYDTIEDDDYDDEGEFDDSNLAADDLNEPDDEQEK